MKPLARAARLGRALALQRLPRPRGDRVLLNSFDGRYSDNPRGIHEALVARGDGRSTYTWIAGEDLSSFPADVRRVELYGSRYLAEVGRAGLVVSNVQMPNNFQKRRSATYLQTWHGTPLKRIGRDNERWATNAGGFEAVARDYARWDYLVSQNAFSTEIFRRAFGFDGEILEEGYPRNDALLAPDREAVRARVRAQLGIEDGVTAVLYAPTWRDNLVRERGALGFSLALDLDEVAARLGDDHVLLLRLHYMIAASVGDAAGPLVRNVSAYPDIRDLYLAADVLITDYSSAMFDFAVTGKPMIFYVYDLISYRDEIRGFYFDLEDEAPGSWCTTSDEVVSALESLPRAAVENAERYRRFVARFCPRDDGRAGRRIVDRVLPAG